MKQFVQGDILFIERDPRSVRELRREAGNVVARGEKTGHAHVIDGDGYLFWDSDRTSPIGAMMDAATAAFISAGQRATRFLRAATDLKVRHDEHGAVDLPAGTWEVIQQQTYDYEKAARERVVD